MRRIIRADNGTRVILILICNDIIDNRYILRVELLYYRGILYWGYIRGYIIYLYYIRISSPEKFLRAF